MALRCAACSECAWFSLTAPCACVQRNADGTFAGHEATPPFEYHDGWLSVHFSTANYQEIQLTPLQEEACW